MNSSGQPTEEGQPQVANANVYVAGLPLNITLRRFRQLFSPFGVVIGARLIPRRKGYSPVGFVQYTCAEMAHAAIATMNNADVDGFTLAVTLARRDKDRGTSGKPSNTLYVANLPKRIGENDLYTIFSRFGMILSLRVLRHQEVLGNRGTALVRFERVEDAIQAKEALHCLPLQATEPPLEVKFAESKEDRKSRLDASKTKKKKTRKDKLDDMNELLLYVAEIVQHYNNDWKVKVLKEKPKCMDVEICQAACSPEAYAMQEGASNADAIRALSEYMKAAVVPKPMANPVEIPSSSLSRASSHDSSSFGYATGSNDGEVMDHIAKHASKMNPKVLSLVCKEHLRTDTADTLLSPDVLEMFGGFAARIVQMDSTQLAKLSALL